MRAKIVSVFENFSKYMQPFLKNGSLPLELPILKIENNKNCNGSYYHNIEQFVLHDLNLATDDGVLRRIHMHYILYQQVIDESEKFYKERFNSHTSLDSRGGVAGAIESGLADYFSCSFDDNPLIGETGYVDCMKVNEDINLPYLRSLENNSDKFFEIPYAGKEFIPLGNVWGATFWEIKRVIENDDVTNSKLIKFWNDMWSKYPDYHDWTNERAYVVFRRILEKEFNSLDRQKIVEIFKKRGLK